MSLFSHHTTIDYCKTLTCLTFPVFIFICSMDLTYMYFNHSKNGIIRLGGTNRGETPKMNFPSTDEEYHISTMIIVF